MSDEVMSATEVAELLGVSTGSLAQMRYMRKGPDYVRLSGRRVRYRRADVERWLQSRRVELKDGAP
jgi:excisionase family DNA binding protein